LPQDYSQILKQSPIFATLSDQELEALAKLTTAREFAADEYVFWEGDPAEWFYVVAQGSIKVSKLSSQGKETIIDFFGPGEMFGEVAVFQNKTYPASSRAESETNLLGIRKSDFIRLLSVHPQVALRIINILSGRLRDSQNRLRDLAGERVEQRLARILMMLSGRLGNNLPFTRQELGDMAGTTTETTIRILSQWKERGIIASARGKIIVSDELKLRLLAEGPPRV
jgi:CRP/FNR family transcriptional regulator, nitrogen oxide reductase regulator